MPKIFLLFMLTFAVSFPMHARGSRSSVTRAPRSSVTYRAHSSTAKCVSCARDSRGKIKRSRGARHAFQNTHPCPSTGRTYGACPGYVVDHIQALKHGGNDSPDNMQWQTTAESKAKDKWE